jgi:hypothetical protein
MIGETTLSQLYSKRRFPMKRFLVLALVGAWSLAGSAGLAFGDTGHPQTPTKPQATKPSPPPPPKKDTRSKAPTPPKKDTRSKALTQASKSPSHRGVKVDVPKGGKQPPAKKGPDWGKVGMGVMEGVFGTAAGISAVTGGAEAVATSPTVVGAIPGAALAAVEGAAAVKEFADAGRDIKEGLEVNDAQKSNQGPATPKNGAQKSNPRPAKPKSGTGR